MQAFKQELKFAINIKVQTKPVVKSINRSSESIYSKQSYGSLTPGPNCGDDGIRDDVGEKIKD